MANLKKTLQFYINLESDGSSLDAKVDFTSDPVSFVPSGVGSGAFLASIFNALPDSIVIASLSCNLGIDAANCSYNALTKCLTVKLASAGTATSIHVLGGTAEYN